MKSILNALLGGTQGLGQGLQQQAKFKADQEDRSYLADDRAAQTALRKQQAEAARLRAEQHAQMGTPEFTDLLDRALGGHQPSVAKVMVIARGSENANEIYGLLNRPPPNKPSVPMTTVVGPGGKPVRGADVPGAQVYVAPEKPEKPDLAPTPGPNGTVVLAPKKAGLVVPGATPTPRMARAPTEAQEKSYLFHNLMDKAEPEIEAAITSGKVRPEAVSAFLTASKIPLAGGLLASLVNSGLNAEEQTLLRSGADFAAGVKRKESGAAVSNPEIAEVFGRYFPGIFGDTPELTASKKAARAAYRETMRQSALPATTYYQQVEKNGAPEIDPTAEAADPGSGNVAPAPTTRSPISQAITRREYLELKKQGFTTAQLAKYKVTP